MTATPATIWSLPSPTKDPAVTGNGPHWFAAKHTIQKPYCWTPTKPFYFGGKLFIPLYPCAAFATKNFGHIIQRGPQGLTAAKW